MEESKYMLYVNHLPKVKIFNWSKLKAFADVKINVGEMMISLCDWVENIVKKCWFSHNVLKNLFFFWGRLKSGLCDKELRLEKFHRIYY